VSSKRTARKRQNFIVRFYRETIGELRKVSWPTRTEAINLTRIVIVVILVLSTILGLLDIMFSRFFALILGS
jgi:preprotein translocase subunit SecE